MAAPAPAPTAEDGGASAAARPAFDYLMIIVAVGDTGVGKSVLLSRFTQGVFQVEYVPSLGVNLFSRLIEVDGKTVKLQIWDACGQERLRPLIASYYGSAHGVMLVYDVTNRASYDSVRDRWLVDVQKNGSHKQVRMLVGTKADVPVEEPLTHRQVQASEGQSLAGQLGISAVEVSAKTGRQVDEAFQQLTLEMLTKWGFHEEDGGCVVQ